MTQLYKLHYIFLTSLHANNYSIYASINIIIYMITNSFTEIFSVNSYSSITIDTIIDDYEIDNDGAWLS